MAADRHWPWAEDGLSVCRSIGRGCVQRRPAGRLVAIFVDKPTSWLCRRPGSDTCALVGTNLHSIRKIAHWPLVLVLKAAAIGAPVCPGRRAIQDRPVRFVPLPQNKGIDRRRTSDSTAKSCPRTDSGG